MVQPVVGEMDGDADSVAKLATFQTPLETFFLVPSDQSFGFFQTVFSL